MKILNGRIGESLFESLYEHLCKGGLCARLMREMVSALAERDYGRCEALCAQVTEVEEQADQIRLAISKGLSTSLFAVVRRSAVVHIVRYQDRICNQAEDAAKLIVLRRTVMPGNTPRELLKLVGKVGDAIDALIAVCRRLAAVPDDAGAGDAALASDAGLLGKLESIHGEEWASDTLLHDFLKELFAHERESDPLSMMLLFDIARMISGMADAAEKAGEAYSEILRQ